MKLKTLFVLLPILAGLAGLGAWILRPLPLALVKPERGPAIEAVYATGTVEPVRWAKVAPTVTGRIVAVTVQEGDRVAAGQVLARLDAGEAQAKVSELAAREKFLKDDVERVRTLAAREVASRQASEKVQSDLSQAEAARQAAQRRLSEYTLTAPQAGVILRRDGEPGEVAQPGQVLFWLGEPKPLRVQAEIDEEDIARIKLGQTAWLKADAFPNEAQPGTVADITPKGDPVNKTYRVRLALPDDTKLLIGMTVEVNVVVREVAQTLLLPASALAEGRIFVVRDGRAHRVPVKVGILGDAKIEIAAGLAEDAMVVRRPPPGLADGARVVAAPEPAAQ